MKWLLSLIVLTVIVLGLWLSFVLPMPACVWAESAIALILILLAALYFRIVRPMSAVRTGVSLLNEQDFSCRLARVGQRDADSIAATFNRMIDTLKAERLRVMEQNHFLDMLIEASPVGIVILNYDGTVRSANPAACRMLGCDRPEGRALGDIPGEPAVFLSHLRLNVPATLRLSDTRIYRCSLQTFIDTGFQRRFFMIESLSDEIMKAERSAYGKVIRLIGHEVNNTVAGLQTLFETVAMIADDSELREAATSCRERCVSLSGFISRYAEVVKLPEPSMRPVRLGELLAGQLPFLESLRAGRDIAIILSVGTDLPVSADAVHIGQVVVNLVKNAIESIGDSGRIDIAVDDRRLTVTDNGRGLTDEAARNIFSPFFSTKEGGQGIGLTLVNEILRAHGCTFSLRTDPATRLTVFSSTFPTPPRS